MNNPTSVEEAQEISLIFYTLIWPESGQPDMLQAWANISSRSYTHGSKMISFVINGWSTPASCLNVFSENNECKPKARLFDCIIGDDEEWKALSEEHQLIAQAILTGLHAERGHIVELEEAGRLTLPLPRHLRSGTPMN